MAVFAVKYRDAVINALWRKKMFAVIGQTLKEIDGVMPMAIGGTDDHVHILFSTNGLVGEAEIVRKVKSESSLWVNNNGLTRCRFAWQRGGARISYSSSAVKDVIAYINNQVEHHKNISFRQEYESILVKLGKNITDFDLPEDLV
ncbi:MAG: transposase [Muribaculaceae bacterium]|nr:transposase [Muribaculaceae bacterium]MDE5594711.1 transposase [Muribaculaceae bacterium]